MRTLIFSAVVATSLLAAPAFAAADKAKADKAKAPVVMTDAQMDNVVAGAAPANPGGFGQDRAAYIATNGGRNHAGYIQDRAGANGQINQDYMLSVESLPAGVTPGQATP